MVPDSAIELTGFSEHRSDRAKDLTGKSRGGGVCFYINKPIFGFYISSLLALNGGGRIFHSPSSLIFPACSPVLSDLLRDSHCTALQTEKLWIWSLNAIDTIFSTRKLGSGEPACPDGTFAAGYTMDAWERWRIVCLAALSVEDIEDIYLFGTMITGLLLIGLGFALGYRRIQKTGTAVQSLTRLPVMTEAVGRVLSIETETIYRNMESIMEKLTALQRKIDDIRDQNGQRE